MTTPRSRLLARTDAELNAALKSGEQLRAHLLRGRLAALLVRQGELEQAREALTQLHQAAFSSPNPALAAWINFAEGLLAYYTDFGHHAGDRLARAVSLAHGCGQREVEAQAHAFLAQLRLADNQVEACGQHLREGFATAAEDDALARARLNMVAAMVLHQGDDAEGASPWYARARQHAAAVGDDATLSALMHNAAQYRVATARRAAAQGRPFDLAGLLPGVQSFSNYDQAMGMQALNVLSPLLRAQVLVVNGEVAEALSLFEQHLPKALAQGLARMGSSLLAETAWCRLRLGQRDAALAQARESELELDPSCDLDDQANTHSRLAQVFAGLDLPQDAARHQALADGRWTEFRALQAQWRAMMAESGLQPA